MVSEAPPLYRAAPSGGSSIVSLKRPPTTFTVPNRTAAPPPAYAGAIFNEIGIGDDGALAGVQSSPPVSLTVVARKLAAGDPGAVIGEKTSAQVLGGIADVLYVRQCYIPTCARSAAAAAQGLVLEEGCVREGDGITGIDPAAVACGDDCVICNVGVRDASAGRCPGASAVSRRGCVADYLGAGEAEVAVARTTTCCAVIW